MQVINSRQIHVYQKTKEILEKVNTLPKNAIALPKFLKLCQVDACAQTAARFNLKRNKPGRKYNRKEDKQLHQNKPQPVSEKKHLPLPQKPRSNLRTSRRHH